MVATLDGYVNAQSARKSAAIPCSAPTARAPGSKGRVCSRLIPRPFNAALAQARAQVTQAEAQLAKSAATSSGHAAREQQAIRRASRREIHAYTRPANVHLSKRRRSRSPERRVHQGESLIDGIAAIATAQIGDLVGPTSS